MVTPLQFGMKDLRLAWWGGGEEKPSAQARERGPRQDRYQTRVVAEMLGVASVLDMFLGISAEQDPGQTAA